MNRNNLFTITDQWQRFELTGYISTGADNFYAVDFRGSSNLSEVILWGAQAVKGNQKDYLKTTDRLDIPRIDYTNGEPSILLEPQRNNVITYSQDFTQSVWTLLGAGTGAAPIVTSNYSTSPDGSQNATRLQFNLNGGTTTTDRSHIRYSSFSSQTDYYYSAYVKSTNGQEQKLLWQHGGDDSEFTVTNQWQRVELDRNGFAETFAGFSLRGGISTVDSADVLIWGFQVEQGSYPTSLIHTSGSAVTRSADSANNAGNSDLINDSEGVLYTEIKASSNDLSERKLTLSNGSVTHTIKLQWGGTANQYYYFVTNASGTQSDIRKVLPNILEYHKVACKWKANDFALWIDGIEVGTNTSGGVPTGMNELAFDNGTGSQAIFSNVKMVAVFKEALTDLELEKLTGYNNHELYMNYYNRLSYLGLAEEYNVESDINNYIL